MSPDHVHILALVPPSISISKAVQYIKGISSRKLLQEVGNVNSEEVQKYIEQHEEHHKKDDFRISEF